MGPVPLSYLQPFRSEVIEDWPWIDPELLRSNSSRRVCVTCQFLRHQPDSRGLPRGESVNLSVSIGR